METPPNLQVYDLGHLGLVASVLDRIRLVKTVDRLVGPRPGEKVSTGMALKAALLNALGFVASPLYLFGHPFQGKPTEHLLGPGITPDLLNDDRMGRMLDTLCAAGVTEALLEVAREARRAFPIPVRALRADATGFHVHGRYEGLGEEVGAIRADTGGIPPLFAPGDGNQKEARAREVDVEEEGLRRRVARAEGEAEKALGRLLSRRFACQADARRALEGGGAPLGGLPPPGPLGGGRGGAGAGGPAGRGGAGAVRGPDQDVGG